jgi:ADP-ribose pyrophosphatase YjhB (NUDIX family)
MPHIHEKIDFTAEASIVHKNKVLLRFHDKYKFWASVGGHVELHEDPNEAVIREIKEEVGLDAVLYDGHQMFKFENEREKYLVQPIAMNRHDISPTHEHIGMVYFATSDSDKVVPEKSDDQWKWVTKEELQNMDLKLDMKFFAEKALEILAK